jgi:hypothetical protein
VEQRFWYGIAIKKAGFIVKSSATVCDKNLGRYEKNLGASPQLEWWYDSIMERWV